MRFEPNTNSTLPGFNTLSPEEMANQVSSAMRRVYMWMVLGLLLTAGTAFVAVASPLVDILASQPILFIGLIIVEFGLVLGISFGIQRISVGTALGLFFLYAVVNGLTLSMIFALYTASSIALAFFATGCLFGAMSIIGYTTKMDLSRLGGFLLMGLIGLIVASIANMFLASTVLDAILTYIGILLFIGLTFYHTQRIKRLVASAQGDEQALGRIGVIGALSLYLDFINLFLYMLRLMGRRR